MNLRYTRRFPSCRPVAFVAQLDRALVSEAEGCGFDPRRTHHSIPRLVPARFCVIAVPMTDVENRLLETLIELETTVSGMATANPKPNLMPLFTRLDEMAGQLPADADPELKHFLVRKSYQKARLLLQGRGPENRRGSCGH